MYTLHICCTEQTIEDVADFMDSIPVSIGFSTPKVNLGCIDLGFWDKCFSLPRISFSIPLPWWPIVRPLQLPFEIVPTSEVIDDEIVDVKCVSVYARLPLSVCSQCLTISCRNAACSPTATGKLLKCHANIRSNDSRRQAAGSDDPGESS
jgi:hypothetical protein